jgi:hypothetical protein
MTVSFFYLLGIVGEMLTSLLDSTENIITWNNVFLWKYLEIEHSCQPIKFEVVKITVKKCLPVAD